MRKEILLAGCGAGLGAGLVYVLDPEGGRRRALERASCGRVTYDFPHENRLVRVTWRRD